MFSLLPRDMSCEYLSGVLSRTLFISFIPVILGKIDPISGLFLGSYWSFLRIVQPISNFRSFTQILKKYRWKTSIFFLGNFTKKNSQLLLICGAQNRPSCINLCTYTVIFGIKFDSPKNPDKITQNLSNGFHKC